MRAIQFFLPVLALIGALLGSGQATFAQVSDKTERILDQLAEATPDNWRALESELIGNWSRSGSDAFDFLLKRAKNAINQGDFPAARGHLDALIDHAPKFAEAYYLRATVFHRAEQLGLAVDDLSSCLSLEPRHFAAMRGLGVIFEELGNPKSALAAYQQSLSIHPQNPDVKDAIARLEAAMNTEI